jgi:Fe-S-cluster containining protein
LSAAEALVWLRDGNPVEVLCEGIPWVEEPPASDLVAAFKRERSFPAMSGGLPIRILVTLAAPLGSGCPHLLGDNRCGIYERRPVVCRTYPAYANPFLKFMPEYRRCPPEAWQPGGSPLMRQGNYVPELMPLIECKNQQAVDDVPLYARVCDALGIRKTAMSNEGFVAHSPAVEDLLEALLAGDSSDTSHTPSPEDWELISDNAETVDAIRSCDARCIHASDVALDGVEYLSLSRC